MAGGQFAATVEAWVREVEGGLLAIVQESTQEVVDLIKKPVGAGGNMPVDTSFLQNSLQGSASSMPLVRADHTGNGQPPERGNAVQIEALIAGMKLGQTLYFGFTAAYALRQNYGFSGTDTLGRNYNQQGRFFVELAVQQWPQLVEKYQRRLAAKLALGV